MPTFNRKTKKYYTISKDDHPNGLIRHKESKSGPIHHYGGVEGILTSIELEKDTFEGETQYKYHFQFEPEGHGEAEILQIGESASAARGLLMTLISTPGQVGWVRVSPYRNTDEETGKTYTNLWTEVNGQTVEWKDEVIDNLPDVEEVEVGDKTVLNDAARRKYVRLLAKRVTNNKLAGKVLHDREAAAQQKDKQMNDATNTPADPQASEPPTGHPSASTKGPDPDQNAADIVMNDLDDLDDSLPF